MLVNPQRVVEERLTTAMIGSSIHRLTSAGSSNGLDPTDSDLQAAIASLQPHLEPVTTFGRAVHDRLSHQHLDLTHALSAAEHIENQAVHRTKLLSAWNRQLRMLLHDRLSIFNRTLSISVMLVILFLPDAVMMAGALDGILGTAVLTHLERITVVVTSLAAAIMFARLIDWGFFTAAIGPRRKIASRLGSLVLWGGFTGLRLVGIPGHGVEAVFLAVFFASALPGFTLLTIFTAKRLSTCIDALHQVGLRIADARDAINQILAEIDGLKEIPQLQRRADATLKAIRRLHSEAREQVLDDPNLHQQIELEAASFVQTGSSPGVAMLYEQLGLPKGAPPEPPRPASWDWIVIPHRFGE